MDKGLITISELEQKIKVLQEQEETNNNKIADSTKGYKTVMKDIDNLKAKIIALSEEKQRNILVPHKRKEGKKNLIKTFILVYVILSAIAMLTIGAAIGTVSSILSSLGAAFLCTTFVSAIVLPVEFKRINKKYPLGDNEEIENQISLNNKKLEDSYSKKKELDELLSDLQVEKINLNDEIDNLEKEIGKIADLRSKVIEQYCKDNPELDKKLDAAYDKSKVKEKVK